MRQSILTLGLMLVLGGTAVAEPPVASYIFPAGGQRGAKVPVRVGGLFLNERCGFEMLGGGITHPPQLRRTQTTWFEGPILAIPESQQAEDYPKDMAGELVIAPEAETGVHYWRVWTSQGATALQPFEVGDLPEVIEQETEGDAVPVRVQFPVTINGRIFPREDVDAWSFKATRDQVITCAVTAARLGTPLDARLEIRDASGRRLAESDDARGADPQITFKAPEDGLFEVRIHDVQFRGGQAFVYRITITTGPNVDGIYPLGGRCGTAVEFAASGQGLPSSRFKLDLPRDKKGPILHSFDCNGMRTNSVILDADDLPESLERGADVRESQPATLPVVLNGRIFAPGEIDEWPLRLQKGEVVEGEVRARQLGSAFEGLITVSDTTGKELARAEYAGRDPTFRFVAPAESVYLLKVADRFRHRGGPAHSYRIKLTHPPGPDFQLKLPADVLTVQRGSETKLKLAVVREGGFEGPIELTVEGVPAGISAKAPAIAAKQGSVEIAFKPEADAKIQVSRLRIVGQSTLPGGVVKRTATFDLPMPPGASPSNFGPLDHLSLAVAMPTPFKIVGGYNMQWAPRGGTLRRQYQIERGGFEGPITIELADRQGRHLQGVTGPRIVIPANESSFEYRIQLAPWMELGRTCRACVMGTGIVREPDGSEHSVTFCSLNANEQLVAVIEAARLGLDLERSSITIDPANSTCRVRFRITRSKELAGPTVVEAVAPEGVRDFKSEAVTLQPAETQGHLDLRFGSLQGMPPSLRITIRATVQDASDVTLITAPLEVQVR